MKENPTSCEFNVIPHIYQFTVTTILLRETDYPNVKITESKQFRLNYMQWEERDVPLFAYTAYVPHMCQKHVIYRK